MITTAVFDTNIVLQGILGEQGPAFACLELVFNDAVELITTEAILEEVRTVISRPNLVRKYPQLRGDRPKDIIGTISKKAKIVKRPSNEYIFDRDPTDEIFINLAITTNAEYLVSRDKDLLDLKSDAGFISQYPSLKIVNPFEFLEGVRAK